MKEEKLQKLVHEFLDAFYTEVHYSLQSNLDLQNKKIKEGVDLTLHAGAKLALENAIENLEIIKARFLEDEQKPNHSCDPHFGIDL